MEKIDIFLTLIGFIITIPLWIIAVILIVLGIMGLIKKDYTKFKKTLKVWGYFWLAFVILLIIKFVSTFIFYSTSAQ